MTNIIVRHPATSTSLNDIRRKVMLLYSEISKHFKSYGIDFSQSDLVKYCWNYIRSNQERTYALYFKKYDRKGEFKEYARRIVLLSTDGYLTFQGTGSPLKPGQRLFVDVARLMVKDELTAIYGAENVKVNTIISTYENYCPITGGSRVTALF